MIFGVDTASYQPLGTYDPASWECINIEDPGIAGKVERNNREGRPTDAYVWCYSNDRNADFFRWAIAKGKELGITRFWLDYEEEGVEGNWRIDIWREVCAQQGVQCGLYSNDWRINHANFLDLPYWYAGYPDPNDGQWKGGAPKASRPVQIWQFTSGGGLDRNVIWDEAWFANWIHGTPPAPPSDLPEESDMLVVHGPYQSLAGNRRAIALAGDKPLHSWFGPSAMGKVQAAGDYAAAAKIPEIVLPTDDPTDPVFAALVALADAKPDVDGGGTASPVDLAPVRAAVTALDQALAAAGA